MIERLTELRTLYQQLFDIGFPPDLDEIVTFRSICNHFLKTGEGASGMIPLRGYKRILVYKLSNQAHITSTVVLKFSPET